jgi:FkbM family methyltransferase
MTNRKEGGYFVDFGATDGIELSNSYLLEKSYKWNGIVAEPSRHFHQLLTRNRSCAVDLECVSDMTGQTVTFNEVSGSGLSSMAEYADSDWHGDERRGSVQYDVRTVSLNDLLDRHGAPARIDYLSIDTEGSELAILSALDFESHLPLIITVEHNFVDEKRAAMAKLLERQGYRRRFETLSMFDDWYVHTSLPDVG